MGQQRIEWVDFFTTQKCNFNCKYCFHKKQGKDLTPQDAVEYLTLLRPIATENMIINFFGGEPLLNPTPIYSLVEYIKSEKLNYRLGICTNGSILNDNLLLFLKNNKFMIQISIDGDFETHDKYREQHSKVVQNIRTLINAGISVTARMTYKIDTIQNLADNIKFIHDLGINQIMHQGVIEDNWTTESYIEYKKQCLRMLELRKSNPKLKISYLDRNSCPSVGLLCKAGKTLIALLPNGDIYPCHHFGSVGSYKLGNIRSGFTRGIFVDIKREDIASCKNCEAKSICHTCIATNYDVNGSLYEPVKKFCGIIKTEKEFVKKEPKEDSLITKINNLENLNFKTTQVVLDLTSSIEEIKEVQQINSEILSKLSQIVLDISKQK